MPKDTQQRGAIDVILRPKRQITLPREICAQLGIEPGDRLELSLDSFTMLARPKKVAALEALREIQETFKRSGITEEELQESGRRIRQKLARQRHAGKT